MNLPREQIGGDKGYLEKMGAEIAPTGEVRTSAWKTLFFIESEYGELPLRERVEQVDRSALETDQSATLDNGSLRLESGTVSGASIKDESHQTLDYAPGKEAEISMYVRREQGVSDNQSAKFGGFSGGGTLDGDGPFFEVTPSDFRMGVRKAGTDRIGGVDITGGAWKAGPDPLEKGLLDEGHIFSIRYLWYGSGAEGIAFGILKPENEHPSAPGERFRRFATYYPQNDTGLTGMWCRTPRLPARFQIKNGGTSPSSQAIFHIGGRQGAIAGEHNRRPRRTHTTVNFSGVGTTWTPILAVRPQLSFAGRPNDVNIRIAELSVVNRSSNDLEAEIEVGGDTDGAFDDLSEYSGTESALEAESTNLTDGSGGSPTKGSGIPVGFYEDVPSGGNSPQSRRPSTESDRAQQPLGKEQPATLWIRARSNTVNGDAVIFAQESH